MKFVVHCLDGHTLIYTHNKLIQITRKGGLAMEVYIRTYEMQEGRPNKHVEASEKVVTQ